MRTSPVFYIAPSSISITPNANNEQRDIAVNVVRGAKIKVLCPRAGIGVDDTSYREWTVTGRNRRLNDAEGLREYTIYIRLPKNDSNGAYLVFAPKTDSVDKYKYLTLDTVDGLSVTGSNVSEDYWYIRLGDVSLPSGGKRTITYDTGILGTDQWNNEWSLNPDALPLRIELGCTIDDEDVGLNPYIFWGQDIILTATLVEGWSGTDIQRFDHWEILRNSGNEEADHSWLDPTREASFSSSGEIALSHSRTNDDFAGAVAVTFTIMAMEVNEDYVEGSAGTPFIPLKTATITILAETVEKYELIVSESIVSYNPQTGEYSPSGGVSVRVSATNQRGEMFDLTNEQISNAQLDASFAPVGTEDWTSLVFTGAPSEVAVATIGISEFVLQQSMNVRLLRVVEDGGSSSGTYVTKELDRNTVAFVRDGEDSHGREWIFLRSDVAITFGDAQSVHPKPALISGGEVNPAGAAGGSDRNKNQDGWVPQGWWDEAQGVNANYPYEYGAYRDYVRGSGGASSSSSDDGGHWGDFSEPRIWSHYGQDGSVIQRMYKTTNSATYSGNLPVSYGNDPNGWNTKPTAINSYYRYRWVTERRSEDGGSTWGTGWSTPQIDAYLSEDGKSLSIAGVASAVIAWGETLPLSPSPDEIFLMNNGDADWLEVWDNNTWEGYCPDEGTCYIVDNDLWYCLGRVATSTSPAWTNLGRFKGEPGDPGENSIHADLDNEYEDMLYDDAGTRISPAVTSQARLYDGSDQVVNSQIEWNISDNGGSTWGISASTNATASISNAGLLTVTGLISETVRIKVRAKYKNKYYYAEFASNKVTQDKYSLHVTPDAITYKDGAYVTQILKHTVDRLDIQGNINDIEFGDYNRRDRISTTSGKGYLRLFMKLYFNGTTRNVQRLSDETNIIGAVAYANDSFVFTLRKYDDPEANNDGSYTIVDYETVVVCKVANGENSIHADLDNEYEDMVYNDAGQRVSPVITSQARLYDGVDDVTSSSDVTWNISDDNGTTWKAPTVPTSTNASAYISSSGELRVDALYSDNVKIKVRALYHSEYYYAEFVSNKIKQDRYSLVLSQNVIPYNPADYTSKNIEISAQRFDVQGNTASITFGSYNNKSKISTTANRGYLRMFVYLIKDNVSRNSAAQLSNTYSVTTQIADYYDALRFELRKYDDPNADNDTVNTVVDHETIPVSKVANGADGVKAPYNVYNYARYDSRAADASTGEPTGNIDTSVGWAQQAPAPVSGYPYIWQKILAYNSSDVLQSTSYVCLTGAKGDTGGQGHTGRFFYYKGEYDSAETYRIEESQAPYVKYNDEFWMLDYHGSEPPYLPWPTDGHPVAPSENSNNPWTKMASEQQYYIARAFFGDFAHLGSFIISGDWMLSQYGTYKPDANTTIIVNDDNILTYPTAYTHFKSNDPRATGEDASGTPTYPCFAPNFAVDGLTGETYQNNAYLNNAYLNNAYLRGEVYATSGEFQNVKLSGGMRSPFTYISPQGTLQTDLSDNVAIYSTSDDKNGIIYNLPWDMSQSGRRVVIANYKWLNGTQNAQGYARLKAPSGKFFYEDGVQKSFITLSREVVELIGYGDSTNFYGWIVLTRTDLGTTYSYGHKLKALAVGRVTVTANGEMTANGVTFDGSALTLQRISAGKYRITFGNTNWFENDESVCVIATGCNTQCYASVQSMDTTGFEVWTVNGLLMTEGSFTFVVLNINDWAMLNIQENSAG